MKGKGESDEESEGEICKASPVYAVALKGWDRNVRIMKNTLLIQRDIYKTFGEFPIVLLEFFILECHLK
jgi:hypothetical protein